MPHKRVLCPERVRQVPPQFSWIDQRLVRDRHLEHCDVQALALYLLLVTVADAQGLSYYGEATLARRLSMLAPRLQQVRADLIRGDLIAYKRPLYQVLSLDRNATPRTHGMQSIDRGIAALHATLAARADRDRRE